ncbi:amidohydrolase family protein, partial [candidate division KSB3 bacterium]|nr:amidohydrolase family protein [candidate division KSB3 bacterium]MBD3327225.1 amidohydrolase family protein [candidate division KSB3 bacterium]
CVDDALRRGALGIKILGGHYPLTPEATAAAIRIANARQAYVAFHAGTTDTKSDLHGFREAVTLIGEQGAHLAHINSYCRGLVDDPLRELMEVFARLEGHAHLVSESYLALINGTSGRCAEGQPVSHVTRNCLQMGGFAVTTEGLEAAIRQGFAQVTVTRNRENVLVHGPEGVEAWVEAATDTTISFAVNSPQVLMLCATAKDAQGAFRVDAFSTDGGGIPRNVTVAKGLPLVQWGALTLEEFVVKSALNPARMLGMVDKGHLGVGADADITVLDMRRGRAVMGISGGKMIMIEGHVVGEQGTVVTTKQGSARLGDSGLRSQAIDLAQSRLYQ